MKRILFLLCFLLLSTNVNAETITSVETSDKLIHTGACVFTGFLIQPDGTNDVIVSFYDNTTATGSEIINSLTFEGDKGPQALPMEIRRRCFKGIYIDITTAGTVKYTVLWER